jgi:hypothetical protein
MSIGIGAISLNLNRVEDSNSSSQLCQSCRHANRLSQKLTEINVRVSVFAMFGQKGVRKLKKGSLLTWWMHLLSHKSETC